LARGNAANQLRSSGKQVSVPSKENLDS